MNSFYKFNIIDLLLLIKKINKTKLSCQEDWKKNIELKIESLIKNNEVRLNKGERKRRIFYRQKMETLKEVRKDTEKYNKLRNSQLIIPNDTFELCKIEVEEFLYLLDYFRMYFKEEKSFKEFNKEFMSYSNFLNSIYRFI